MISFYFKTENRFSRYGINHFIEKFGIPVEINKPSQSGIVIAYGLQAGGDFVISVEKNDIQNTVCGKISIQNEKIPICEIPHDTGTYNEVIAYFETDSTRFPCVTKKDGGVSIGIDIFKETGYLLSGHLDAIRPSLDSTAQKELALKPVVDFLENLLFDAILASCHRCHVPLVQKSYWPEGKTFAVCLTHDVDEIQKTYQWISRPLGFLVRGNFLGFKGQIKSFLQKIKRIEPYYTYDDIIQIEQDLGVKSTYFILKESGKPNLLSKKTWYLYGRNRSLQSPEMQALIHKLKKNGDEIAIHGSFFSYLQPELLNRETRELEGVINEKIAGSRQHNLNLDIPRTWEYQILAGLHYDATLGFKDSIGFRWGTAFPFFPLDKDTILPLLEIPLIIMDICVESIKNKELDCFRIANEVEKYQGVLSLLWHPPMFNTLENSDLRNTYIKINQYCLNKGAWITRALDIFEWLTFRNQQAFSCYFENMRCTINPSVIGRSQFFTLYLPFDNEGTVISNNAEIIRKEGRYLYIKTHDLRVPHEIMVDFA